MTHKKTYNPEIIESKWYELWERKGFFKSKPNPQKVPYSIVIPPPNVTGVLHMGHMLNNTIQDVLVRRARMQGYETCWVPGIDHASIATEAKVVAMLKEKGIEKNTLTREEFLAYAWQWKEKYGNIILNQLKKLGVSCDWDRTKFTMDKPLYDAVIDVFVDLYRRGYIYRGYRMVNWDIASQTALSDEEVIYKEVNSKLFYLKYKIFNSNEYLPVATTRPETIMGDVALCVNPNDERYIKWVGQKAIVPLVNRLIPIISDDYVDKDFGTGCLKVTPAHDFNDFEIGQKYNLPILDIMDTRGILTEKAELYVGLERFEARNRIVKDLEAAGLLLKIEDIKNNVGFSERTDVVIEPRLSIQWFVDMKKILKNYPQILDAVMNDEIKLYPSKFKNTYRHWLENVKDWCISRQLWWGHQIPAWYAPNGEFVVAHNVNEALIEFKKKGFNYNENDLKQDEDVLDTWFSSWLWPISVFDTGIFKKKEPNEEIKYYYPTQVLVTAPEILFFWVARMIMAGYLFMGEKPFRHVYLTGIVRDKLGRKMSKSLGNSPEPLDLIKKYGADGVRVGMLLSAPAGNDLLFDEKYCEQGRNFWNKLWNAYRLLDSFKVSTFDQPYIASWANEWFTSIFNQTLQQIEDHYTKFRISDALMSVYKLIWDEFCSNYLEIIKPDFEKAIDHTTYNQARQHFCNLLKIVHPFMPFISEELWYELHKNELSFVSISTYPRVEKINNTILDNAELAFKVISNIRNLRNSKQIPFKQALKLFIKAIDKERLESIVPVIQKMAFIEVMFVDYSIENSYTFQIHANEFFVPLQGLINENEEKERLYKELEYTRGFLKSVEAKLNNEKFVAFAKPEVVENEKKKYADAKAKIEALEKLLKIS